MSIDKEKHYITWTELLDKYKDGNKSSSPVPHALVEHAKKKSNGH